MGSLIPTYHLLDEIQDIFHQLLLTHKDRIMSELAMLQILYHVFLEALAVVGVMANGFVVALSCLDLLRNKTLTPSDLILLALSMSRFLLLALIFGVNSYYDLEIHLPKYLSRFIVFIVSFFNTASLWMATCLVVFYSIKIVNFAQPCLLKMKVNISGIVPQLLLGSMLLSLLIAFSVFMSHNCEHCCNETKISLSNSSGDCLLWMNTIQVHDLVYIVGTFPFFILFLVSSVLLIHSLLQHSKRMRRNTEGFKDHMMDVHLKAIKTVLSLLILFCAAFAAEVTACTFNVPWTYFVSKVMIVAYHTGHAMIVIAVNPKLKQALIKTWWYTIGYCLRQDVSVYNPKTSEKADHA